MCRGRTLKSSIALEIVGVLIPPQCPQLVGSQSRFGFRTFVALRWVEGPSKYRREGMLEFLVDQEVAIDGHGARSAP